MILFKNANIVSNGQIINSDLLVENGTISKIGDIDTNKGYDIIDCTGLYLSAGFIDLHVHGGGGFSSMSDNPADIVSMCYAHAKHGTTSILPTFLSASLDDLMAYSETVSIASKQCDKSNILGVYFEGPYISKKAAGAQNSELIFNIDDNTASKLLSVSNLKMITIAPETESAMDLAKQLSKNGIVVSMGHTRADFETTERALKSGFSDITHIYNACSSYQKNADSRIAGAAEAALCDDNCTVQFIGDLKHIPAGLIKLIYKCKGAYNAYPVTDGLEFSASDLREGQTVKQKNGISAVCSDGVMKTIDKRTIAGSISTMDTLVKNLYKTVGIGLAECIEMATATPARVMSISDQVGYMKEGYIADIVVFDENIDIKHVMVKGKFI